MDRKNCAVTLASGGIDSTVLLYAVKELGLQQYAIAFNYGQKHAKELEFFQLQCDALGVERQVIDLPLGDLLNSALTTHTSGMPTADAEDVGRVVVPNRNAIMLNIAAGIAVSREFGVVATGVHGGDHNVFPDCREPFLRALQNLWNTAFDEGEAPELRAPFLSYSKADIVSLGTILGVNFADTWTCYEGGEVHCGRCPTCVERREAFVEVKIPDPTKYLA